MDASDPIPDAAASRPVLRARSLLPRRRRRAGEPLAAVLGDFDLMRPIALGRIHMAVVVQPGAPIRASRWVDEGIDWDGGWSDRLLDGLLAFAGAAPARPTLFYQRDEDLLFVTRHRDALAAAFDFVLAPTDVVDRMVDKVAFTAAATEERLRIPATTVIRPGSEPRPSVGSLPLPMVIKPAARLEQRWLRLEAKRKAIPVTTEAELDAAWEHLGESGEAFLAQAMIPGAEDRIESYHAYVEPSGRVAVEFAGRKIRTRPQAFGHTTSCEITEEADVLAAGRDAVERLGITGAVKLDYKRAPDGTLYLLEANPRFNLWHHPGAVAGANIPATVHADLTGRPRAPYARGRAGVRWMRVEDLLSAREQHVSPLRWVAFAATCESRQALAWDDPAPIVAGAARRLVRFAAGLPRRRTAAAT